jgi:alpha-galactosidase
MGAVTAAVARHGVKLGGYTARGRLTCAGRAGSLGHEAEDMRRMAVDWGWAYVKIDSCHGTPPDTPGSPEGTAAIQQYRLFAEGLNATGRRVVLDACWPTCWPVSTCISKGPPLLMGNRSSVANSWRIGPDGLSWGRVALNLEIDANLSRYAGPGHWNNPGLLISTKLNGDGSYSRRTSETQTRAQFSLFCVVAAPLLISGSVAQMSPTDLATYTNREAIAISQDPLGAQGVRLVGGPLVDTHTANPIGAINVWGRRLASGGLTLVFLNTGGQPTDVVCNASCLTGYFAAGDTVSVRDIWANTTRQVRLTATGITAHNVSGGGGCMLVTLTKIAAPVGDTAPHMRLTKTDGGRSSGAVSAGAVCSLNGRSEAGKCVCDAGWSGSDCQYINLPPVDLSQPQGYGRVPNVTSWGASLVAATNVSGGPPMYHLFVTEEVDGCGMAAWKTNSQVVHAVASKGTGPFRRVGVLVPFATNPAVHYDASARLYRMLVLPTGSPGKQRRCDSVVAFAPDGAVVADANNCTAAGGSQCADEAAPLDGSSQLYSAETPEGNWTLTPASFPNCNNPSGAVDAVGTAWLMCHGGVKGYGPGFFLYSAAGGWTSSAAEWTSHGNILRTADGVPESMCEDPMMWIHPITGDFHALAHCYSTLSFNGSAAASSEYCAAHLFADNTSQTAPWGFHGAANAPYGFARTFSSRERPFVALGSDGVPTFLLTAVSPLAPIGNRAARGKDWTWTLSQPVGAGPQVF